MTSLNSPKGPTGYENWRAFIAGNESRGAFEFQLYSDAHLVDEVTAKAGPYAILNAVPANAIGSFTHVATARVSMHVPATFADTSRTDYSRYHGGWLTHELSALCSLLTGVRLKGGGVSRTFDKLTPLGQPRADTRAPTSPLPPIHEAWIIPRARGQHNVQDLLLPRLGTYPRLAVPEAVALVRAARLYQDAIWIAESEPELAWLFLVAGVEVLATQHQVATCRTEDILEKALPGLHAELARAGGTPLVELCGKHLERHLRATSRFITFLDQFLPEPPARPEARVEIPWDRTSLRKAFSQIYNYRSLALHDGTPFPQPMCDPAFMGGLYHERPAGIAAGTSEAAWMSADLPMLLHVFEYIARNAMLGWWDSVVAAQPSVAPGQLPPAPSATHG
jgi:hypothetical protein